MCSSPQQKHRIMAQDLKAAVFTSHSIKTFSSARNIHTYCCGRWLVQAGTLWLIGDVCHRHGGACGGRIGVERLFSLTRDHMQPFIAHQLWVKEVKKKMGQSAVVRDPSRAGTPFLPSCASVSWCLWSSSVLSAASDCRATRLTASMGTTRRDRGCTEKAMFPRLGSLMYDLCDLLSHLACSCAVFSLII